MRTLLLAAGLGLAATPALAAPFAILRLDGDAIELVDLGTLAKVGDRAGYQKVTVHRAVDSPPPRPDRTVFSMEADCLGERVRVQALAIAERGGKPVLRPGTGSGWTSASADELRLACTGQLGGLQVIPSLDVARAILNSGSSRSAD